MDGHKRKYIEHKNSYTKLRVLINNIHDPLIQRGGGKEVKKNFFKSFFKGTNETNLDKLKAALELPEDNNESLQYDYVTEKTRNSGGGSTILHYAVLNKDVEILRYILENAGEEMVSKLVEHQNSAHFTPLTFAINENFNKSRSFDMHMSEYRDVIVLLLQYMTGKFVDRNIPTRGNSILHYCIAYNNYYAVERILKDYYKDHEDNINIKNIDGFTPLDLASKMKLDNIVPLLIEHGARFGENYNKQDSDTGNTPLHEAILNNNVELFKLIMKDIKYNINDINIKNNDNLTPIDLALNMYAANFENAVLYTNALLDKGAEINFNNVKIYANENTLLHIAADNVINKLIHHILTYDKNIKTYIDLKNSDGLTPLQLYLNKYTRNNDNNLDPKIIELFVLNGVDQMTRDKDGNTALHMAVYLVSVSLITYLLTNKDLDVNSVNSVNNISYTPLHIAINNLTYETLNENIAAYKQILTLLREYGADINKPINNGNTILHMLIIQKSPYFHKIIDYIKDNIDGNIVNDNGKTALGELVNQGIINENDIYVMCILIDITKDIMIHDKDGNTVLHIAIIHGKYYLAKHLATVNEMSVDDKNNDNLTVFQLAVSKVPGDINVIDLFCKKTSNINQLDDNKNTLLHLAIKNNNYKFMKVLIDNGIRVNETNNDSLTALQIEMKKKEINSYAIIEMASSGEKSDQVDNNGNTLLHLAAMNGNKDIIKYIIEYYPSNTPNNDGLTPLEIVLLHSPPLLEIVYTIIQILVSSKKILSSDELFKKPLDKNGNTMVHLVFSGTHIQLKQLLLDLDVDLNVPNAKGITPINIIFTDPADPMVLNQVTQKLGKDIYNVKDINGNTMLHSAVKNRNIENVKLLLNEGIDINAANNEGLTPLHIAIITDNKRNTNHYDIARFLLEKNADDKMVDNNYNTCLHMAVKHNNKIARNLILRDATIDVVNDSGETPLLLCRTEADIEYLLKLGAYIGVCNIYYKNIFDIMSNNSDYLNIFDRDNVPYYERFQYYDEYDTFNLPERVLINFTAEQGDKFKYNVLTNLIEKLDDEDLWFTPGEYNLNNSQGIDEGGPKREIIGYVGQQIQYMYFGAQRILNDKLIPIEPRNTYLDHQIVGSLLGRFFATDRERIGIVMSHMMYYMIIYRFIYGTHFKYHDSMVDIVYDIFLLDYHGDMEKVDNMLNGLKMQNMCEYIILCDEDTFQMKYVDLINYLQPIVKTTLEKPSDEEYVNDDLTIIEVLKKHNIDNYETKKRLIVKILEGIFKTKYVHDFIDGFVISSSRHRDFNKIQKSIIYTHFLELPQCINYIKKLREDISGYTCSDDQFVSVILDNVIVDADNISKEEEQKIKDMLRKLFTEEVSESIIREINDGDRVNDIFFNVQNIRCFFMRFAIGSESFGSNTQIRFNYKGKIPIDRTIYKQGKASGCLYESHTCFSSIDIWSDDFSDKSIELMGINLLKTLFAQYFGEKGGMDTFSGA